MKMTHLHSFSHPKISKKHSSARQAPTAPLPTNLNQQSYNHCPRTTTLTSKPTPHSIFSRKKKTQKTSSNTASPMAASPSPVEIGSRGTIASLVSKEIEYFQRVDIIHQERSQKPKTVITNILTRNKKKVAGRGRFLPSICSAVEINTSTIRADRVTGISYKNLRTESKRFAHN